MRRSTSGRLWPTRGRPGRGRKALAVACLALGWGGSAAAHVDVLVARQGDRLVTGSYDFSTRAATVPVRVFAGGLSEDGDLAFGDAPGFNAIAEPPVPYLALPGQVEVVVEGAVSRELSGELRYWDGRGEPAFGPVPEGQRLSVILPGALGPAAWFELGAATAPASGFPLARADARGQLHQHLQFVVQSGRPGAAVPAGVYAFSLALRVDGLRAAEPVVIAVSFGVGMTVRERAVAHLRTLAGEQAAARAPGGCAVGRPARSRGGAGALVLLMLSASLARRRGHRESNRRPHRRCRGLLRGLALLWLTGALLGCADGGSIGPEHGRDAARGGAGGQDGARDQGAAERDAGRGEDVAPDLAADVTSSADGWGDAGTSSIAGDALGDAGALDDAAADASEAGCAVEYRAGHGDLFVRYEMASQSLRLSLRSHLQYPDPSGPLPEHDPTSICIVVPYSSYESIAAKGGRPSVGDPDAFEPIGVPAGASFWILEANNLGPAQPFLGLSTEGVPRAVLDGPVRFTFEPIVRPPGAEFSLYTVQFLPRFHVSTFRPARTASGMPQVELAPGGHAHYHWSFSHSGSYDLWLVASGRTPAGAVLSSARTRFRFLVEDR